MSSYPLHEAARNGYADVVAELVRSNPSAINSVNENGVTPLRLAVAHGNEEIAIQLLNSGASPNIKDNGGSTPLHLAAMYDRRNAARALLARRADVNAVDGSGKTPMFEARRRNFPEMVQLLTQFGGR